MSFEATALVLAWGAIVLLAFAMAGLLRQVKALSAALVGEAPEGVGPARGQRVPRELLAGPGSNGGSADLLIFMERDCPGCAAIAPELEHLGETSDVPISLVFAERAKPMGNGRFRVLEDMSATFERLQIPATPFAVRVSGEGEIADAAAIGSPEALRRFLKVETRK